VIPRIAARSVNLATRRAEPATLGGLCWHLTQADFTFSATILFPIDHALKREMRLFNSERPPGLTKGVVPLTMFKLKT